MTCIYKITNILVKYTDRFEFTFAIHIIPVKSMKNKGQTKFLRLHLHLLSIFYLFEKNLYCGNVFVIKSCRGICSPV